MDLSNLLQMDLLKLLHGFVKVILCFSCPLSNNIKLKFDHDVKACWGFCFKIKPLNESKYSMPWVRCAFGSAVLADCVTSKLLQLMASSIAHKLTQYRQYNLLLENNTFLGLQRKIYLFIYLFNDCSRLEHCVRRSSSGCKRWITFDSKLKKETFKLYICTT